MFASTVVTRRILGSKLEGFPCSLIPPLASPLARFLDIVALVSSRMLWPCGFLAGKASSKTCSGDILSCPSKYGFRGEALYSLGRTSLLEIQSRCAGEQAHAKVGHTSYKSVSAVGVCNLQGNMSIPFVHQASTRRFLEKGTKLTVLSKGKRGSLSPHPITALPG